MSPLQDALEVAGTQLSDASSSIVSESGASQQGGSRLRAMTPSATDQEAAPRILQWLGDSVPPSNDSPLSMKTNSTKQVPYDVMGASATSLDHVTELHGRRFSTTKTCTSIQIAGIDLFGLASYSSFSLDDPGAEYSPTTGRSSSVPSDSVSCEGRSSLPAHPAKGLWRIIIICASFVALAWALLLHHDAQLRHEMPEWYQSSDAKGLLSSAFGGAPSNTVKVPLSDAPTPVDPVRGLSKHDIETIVHAAVAIKLREVEERFGAQVRLLEQQSKASATSLSEDISADVKREVLQDPGLSEKLKDETIASIEGRMLTEETVRDIVAEQIYLHDLENMAIVNQTVDEVREQIDAKVLHSVRVSQDAAARLESRLAEVESSAPVKRRIRAALVRAGRCMHQGTLTSARWLGAWLKASAQLGIKTTTTALARFMRLMHAMGQMLALQSIKFGRTFKTGALSAATWLGDRVPYLFSRLLHAAHGHFAQALRFSRYFLGLCVRAADFCRLCLSYVIRWLFYFLAAGLYWCLYALYSCMFALTSFLFAAIVESLAVLMNVFCELLNWPLRVGERLSFQDGAIVVFFLLSAIGLWAEAQEQKRKMSHGPSSVLVGP